MTYCPFVALSGNVLLSVNVSLTRSLCLSLPFSPFPCGVFSVNTGPSVSLASVLKREGLARAGAEVYCGELLKPGGMFQ